MKMQNDYTRIKAVNKMKQVIAGALFVSGLMITSSVYAKPVDLTSIQKQMLVMNNIIKSSVKAQRGTGGGKISAIDSVYLQGQGAIFTISAHGFNRSRHDFNFVMPTAPVAPTAPGAFLDDDIHVEVIEFDEDIYADMESQAREFEQAVKVFEKQQEHARSLRDEQREIAYEMRELSRESKDIAYQQRRADKETKAKLAVKVQEIEKKQKALKETKVSLEKQVKQLNEQQKKQKLAQAKEREAYFKSLSNGLIETLCLYGNGLRAVPKNEHVSFIIKSAGEREGRNYKDVVYVFSKSDINDCASDKISMKKLLAKASHYQF
ncbi:hypothetical protein [Litorilituus sediminis]|uniref:Uncharacterized protein n=1 Tax=Litorilituus sediminis TaxID=718192 RepID=A0A4P6P8D8_9GAMM|nr:hypothetical protein [Litorilituus sediminis]QBG37378.1 hypothetical protein EMK97_17360 [Litorilituus sediminis]